MTSLICVDDYLDPDVGYLLGLIAARGEFYVKGDVRRLVINFPYRLFDARPPEGSRLKFDVPTETRLCLDDVRNRINDLLEVNVEIVPTTFNAQLVAKFTKNTMSWRNLTTILAHRTSYEEFEVPRIMFDAPKDIQLEFARGFADASATPSRADHIQFGSGPKFHRIVLQINHKNWHLPIQLCRLFQANLGVPVQHILWGHPNLRDPKGRGRAWAKEHRIRIYAEDFMPVGFRFGFKQAILEDMASRNRKRKNPASRPCNPLAKHRIKEKIRHQDEKAKGLPGRIRGQHFDSYFQICRALGCTQGHETDQIIQISEK